MDQELERIALTINEIRQRLQMIQRDDGEVANKTIGIDQLKAELLAGVNPPTEWAPETIYSPGDTVVTGTSWLLTREQHLSSPTIQQDIDAGYWFTLIDLTIPIDNLITLTTPENWQDIETVASNIDNVNATRSNIGDINTVVANILAINTNADNIASINTAATNIADIHNFSAVWQGASSTDPNLRADGSPLQVGDLYFNTNIDAIRTWNGSIWIEGEFTPPATATIIVDNVSQLKSTAIPSGQLVETKGYHSAGDGGQARYLIQTSAEFGSTPDEYGNHTLANGNVAVLQVEGAVNVGQFGAKGDGVTDDTASIQSAINSCNYVTGLAGKLYGVKLKDGQSYCLQLQSEKTLTGIDLKQLDNSNAITLLDIKDDSFDVTISNLTADGNKSNNTITNGYFFTGGLRIKNIRLSDLNILNFENRNIMTQGRPSTTEEDYADGFFISNIKIENNGNKGLQVRATKNCVVTGVRVNSDIVNPNYQSGAGFECSMSMNVVASNIIVNHNQNEYGPGIRIVNGCSDINVSGFKIQGGRQGVFITDSQNVIVRDGTCHGTQPAYIGSDNLDNLAGRETKNVKVDSVTFSNINGTRGVNVRSIHPTSSGITQLTLSNIACKEDVIKAGHGIEIISTSGIVELNGYNNTIENYNGGLYLGINSPDVLHNSNAVIGNLISGVVQVPNNSAVAIPLPVYLGTSREGIVEISVRTVPLWTSALWYRDSNSTCGFLYNLTPSRVETSTGSLSGSTGNANNVTYSLNNEGVIYIENRSGSMREFFYNFRNCI